MLAIGGEVLAERASAGADVDRPANIKSASKSVIGALAGIAIDQGLLSGVDRPLDEVLPENVVDAAPEVAKRLRLEHLLTMTAGLASTSFENYGAWVSSGNWLRSALARDAVAAPGERFIYSTGNAHLLGAAIAEAAGLPLPEYADRVLFGPLGITATWDHDPQGNAFAGNNLSVSTRGLLRFGQLMAAGGVWQGRQLVPRQWVEASTRRQSEGLPERYGAYGYLWWLPEGEPKLWLAAGFGSQLLVVAPESRVVAAVTATLEPKDAAWERRVLEEVRELARAATPKPDS
jgi:CubicO group peptidase (beta-lactamase class C family)